MLVREKNSEPSPIKPLTSGALKDSVYEKYDDVYEQYGEVHNPKNVNMIVNMKNINTVILQKRNRLTINHVFHF